MPGMKPGMMMLMSEIDRRQRHNTSEYSGGDRRRMIGYDRDYNAENRRRYAEGDGWQGNRMDYDGMEPEYRRRRDGRGRFMEADGMPDMRGYPRSEYDESRYGMDDRYEPEARRRRDSRGRYMMDGRMGGMDDEDDDVRGQTWYPPNMMGGSRYGFGDVYADIHTGNARNRTRGAVMDREMRKPVDEETARAWVEDMSKGEHFEFEQTEQIRSDICPECKRWEFYVAMNAMYSDHCESAKKIGMDKPEVYAYLAKDFLMDDDAGPHKLRKYMTIIPK